MTDSNLSCTTQGGGKLALSSRGRVLFHLARDLSPSIFTNRAEKFRLVKLTFHDFPLSTAEYYLSHCPGKRSRGAFNFTFEARDRSTSSPYKSSNRTSVHKDSKRRNSQQATACRQLHSFAGILNLNLSSSFGDFFPFSFRPNRKKC